MYKEKKEKQQQILERNIIGSNTSIVGDVISEGDFRIDGKVEGTIKTGGRVVIGKSGTAIGKIECSDADIEGKFSGELHVNNLLTLKSSAKISGQRRRGDRARSFRGYRLRDPRPHVARPQRLSGLRNHPQVGPYFADPHADSARTGGG